MSLLKQCCVDCVVELGDVTADIVGVVEVILFNANYNFTNKLMASTRPIDSYYDLTFEHLVYPCKTLEEPSMYEQHLPPQMVKAFYTQGLTYLLDSPSTKSIGVILPKRKLDLGSLKAHCFLNVPRASCVVKTMDPHVSLLVQRVTDPSHANMLLYTPYHDANNQFMDKEYIRVCLYKP